MHLSIIAKNVLKISCSGAMHVKIVSDMHGVLHDFVNKLDFVNNPGLRPVGPQEYIYIYIYIYILVVGIYEESPLIA